VHRRRDKQVPHPVHLDPPRTNHGLKYLDPAASVAAAPGPVSAGVAGAGWLARSRPAA
jgi:hypothetical protein